ncbi:NADPH:quinone reductase [Raineyella antarctica]|uniref:NADPH:quinone reductase n=1 Tax=Raineyella antarctica TaxID=1577474 RepID=A0A1G6IML3_9ACTN|nr:NADP-dependent oxidoreductase [Raineyella antarctica]SDC07727.1 NADPH:quinone reductase [Raineyella antarctica]
MKAVQYSEYGDSSVLELAEVPEPHPGPGQIRIRVHAAGVNLFDAKLRSDFRNTGEPLPEPVVPGSEAAGIVDEIGEGVSGVSLGDEVFGRGPATYAEYAVLRDWALQPSTLTSEQAAGLGATGQTAVRALAELGVGPGETLLVHGAAGGVGQAAIQLARHRGATTIIGTASVRNHELLRQLGAIPVEYGEHLVENVRAAASGGVDHVLDAAGQQVDELVEIAGDPQKVLSLVDFSRRTPVRTSHGGKEPAGSLQLLAELAEKGEYTSRVAATFPLAEAPAAHDLSESGTANGKIVLVVD